MTLVKYLPGRPDMAFLCSTYDHTRQAIAYRYRQTMRDGSKRDIVKHIKPHIERKG